MHETTWLYAEKKHLFAAPEEPQKNDFKRVRPGLRRRTIAKSRTDDSQRLKLNVVVYPHGPYTPICH